MVRFRSCDPAPEPFHTLVLAKGDGTVVITIRWAWDGVSVIPNCVGTLQDVRLQNTGSVTWYLELPNGRLAKRQPITPGLDRTFTGAQLEAAGLVTPADIEGLTIVRA